MGTVMSLVLLTTAGASAATAGAVSLAQAAGDSGTSLAPYVTGSGSALAVGAIVVVVKKFLDGSLVSKQTADRERESTLMLAASAEREDRLMKVVVDLMKVIEDKTKQQEDTNRVLWKAMDRLGDVEDRRKPRRQT